MSLLKLYLNFQSIKKFRVNDSKGTLIYDSITSWYPLNIISDYYQNYITGNITKKIQVDGIWYIRPHNLDLPTILIINGI